MDKRKIIAETRKFVKKFFAHDSSGHDYWHSYRVWQNAKLICKSERADRFVVELASLLHDIADRKFTGDDKSKGLTVIADFLRSCAVKEKTIHHICDVAANMSYSDSFKDGNHVSRLTTIEGKIVQDADRLDALGAIGIARAFAYGGAHGRAVYDPGIKPSLHKTRSDYTTKLSHSVNHFYEKLLLLKGLMNTKAGKKLAAKRHSYMEKYLKEFYGEWRGEL